MVEIWEKWKVIAEKIGNFQATVIFSILYYFMVVPFGVTSSLFQDFFKENEFPEWGEFSDNSSTQQKLRLQ